MSKRNKKISISENVEGKKSGAFYQESITAANKSFIAHIKANNDAMFSFVVKSDFICMDNSYWGFHFRSDFKQLRYLSKLLDLTSMTWRAVGQMKSCHYSECYKLEHDFKEKIQECHGESAPETLYQIRLMSGHRIWGYRENDIFYVMFNDPEHKGWKDKGYKT